MHVLGVTLTVLTVRLFRFEAGKVPKPRAARLNYLLSQLLPLTLQR